MNKKTWPLLAAILTIVLTLAFLSGCSNSNPPIDTPAERQLAAHPLDLLLTDCSPSFKDRLDEFTDTIQAVTLDSASRGRRLWHGCFDGSPLRTLTWRPKVDFGNLPDSVKASQKVQVRFTEARAAGTVKKISEAIAATEPLVGGSGQLEAIEVAAKTPAVGRVMMISDLLSFEVDGITLATATDADINKAVKLWLPRLGGGLEGVQVFVVGYGLEAGSSKAARSAVELFTRLITRAGGRVSITKDLPPRLTLDRGGR